MNAGLIGAIVGTVLGLAGGVIGTAASLLAAKSSAERRYTLQCAAGLSVVIGALLVALWIVPSPYHVWVWGSYSILLPVSIFAANRGYRRFQVDHRAGTAESGDAR